MLDTFRAAELHNALDSTWTQILLTRTMIWSERGFSTVLTYWHTDIQKSPLQIIIKSRLFCVRARFYTDSRNKWSRDKHCSQAPSFGQCHGLSIGLIVTAHNIPIDHLFYSKEIQKSKVIPLPVFELACPLLLQEQLIVVDFPWNFSAQDLLFDPCLEQP